MRFDFSKIDVKKPFLRDKKKFQLKQTLLN